MRSRSGSVSAAMLVSLTAALGILSAAGGLPSDLTASEAGDGYAVTDGSTAVTLEPGAAGEESNVTVCTPEGCTSVIGHSQGGMASVVTCAVSGDASTTLGLLEQATGRTYTLQDAAAATAEPFTYQNRGSTNDGALDLTLTRSTIDLSTFESPRHFDYVAVCEDMYDDMYAIVAAGSAGSRVYGFAFTGGGGAAVID